MAELVAERVTVIVPGLCVAVAVAELLREPVAEMLKDGVNDAV